MTTPRTLVFSLVPWVVLAAACSSEPNAISSPQSISPAFPSEVYPPPAPTLSEGGAILSACPSREGIERLTVVADSEVVSLLRKLWSGDTQAARRVTDPGLWPVLSDLSAKSTQPGLGWLASPPKPASESPYANALARQCGDALVRASWTSTVCPGDCQDQTSASLNEDLFLLSRGGTLLVWAIWP
jgi:hypothetical protein